MDEDERRDENEEMNEENDAREEDIVEDADADTEDVVENDDDNYRNLASRIDRIEELLERIEGSITALRDAQGIMVDNGATIVDDDEEIDLVGVDDYVSPNDLDLTI